MKTKKCPKTPELDRMKEVREKSQVIGGFIEWLEVEHDGELPTGNVEKILIEYFKIDLKKVEKERRTILAALRG